MGLLVSAGLAGAESALAACGCADMTITRQNNVTMCSPRNIDDFNECAKLAPNVGGNNCGANEYQYTCPTGANSQILGGNSPSQKTGFYVDATYDNGSNEAHCTPGQILQMSIVSNGQAAGNPTINTTSVDGDTRIGGQDVRIDNNQAHEFPQVGAMVQQVASFGGDNYRQPGDNGVLSGSSNAGSWWWDNTDQEKDLGQGEAATWRYSFVSFVNGSGGQRPNCACAFNINVTWNANQNPVTAYVYDAGNSVNCGGLQ
ncbi:hypothetical protein [Nisaea denitrificans]|uniref:hypothetical protein n=1 Tax=Nisaea denitrificans TaxID=390877 RepID=UPI0012EC4653|nr:hypothetical protein [Nisaea denitrificans]